MKKSVEIWNWKKHRNQLVNKWSWRAILEKEKAEDLGAVLELEEASKSPPRPPFPISWT